MAQVPKRKIIRTKSMWLQITLVDTLFNHIYELCLHDKAENYIAGVLQHQLNQFYSVKKYGYGSAIYNSLDSNYTVNFNEWRIDLSARVTDYRWLKHLMSIDSKAKTNNGIKINHSVVDNIQRYLLGIRDILRNLIL